jgi:hypothetical protein
MDNEIRGCATFEESRKGYGDLDVEHLSEKLNNIKGVGESSR